MATTKEGEVWSREIADHLFRLWHLLEAEAHRREAFWPDDPEGTGGALKGEADKVLALANRLHEAKVKVLEAGA